MVDHHSFLLELGRELRAAVRAGTALAALTCATSCATTEPEPGEPYSLDQVGCFGPSHDGGYYGQCCFEARCYTPGKGEACASTETILSQRPIGPGTRASIPLPPGSGSCGCELPDEGRPALAGPFAPNGADTPEPAGSCCYIVGSISCTGRPLVIDGTQLIASAIERLDWLA